MNVSCQYYMQDLSWMTFLPGLMNLRALPEGHRSLSQFSGHRQSESIQFLGGNEWAHGKQLARMLMGLGDETASLPCTNGPLLTIPEPIGSWPTLSSPSQFPDPPTPTLTLKRIFWPWRPAH